MADTDASMSIDDVNPPVVVSAALSTEPTASTAPTNDLPAELLYPLVCGWAGKKYELTLVQSDLILDLKAALWSLTNVPVERQKIVGLVKGKLPGDEVEVVSLGLSAGGAPKQFMMIGTPEGAEHKEIGPTQQRDKELDIDYSAAQTAANSAAQGVRNRRKLKEATEGLTLDMMNAPRPGKKLLVLDLDYCILDTGLWKSEAFVADHFARPYLHDFLKVISPFYDIVIWSQTSWRFLEVKLMELNIIGETSRYPYPVLTTVDRRPMFSVYSQRDGKSYKHEVKALGILWQKFPEHFSEANTIHVDDLSRNFAMNPRNGLKVKAYKDAMQNADSDHELVYVARYLLQLVNVPDFSKLDHTLFKRSKLPLPPGVTDPATWTKRKNLAQQPSTSNSNASSGSGAPPSAST